jgi:hypothetical protein
MSRSPAPAAAGDAREGRVRVSAAVPRRLYAELERAAAQSQTSVGHWLVALVDAHFAGERCRHGDLAAGRSEAEV